MAKVAGSLPRASATIREIAARLGVSVGTVSRALNGRTKENRPAIARRGERIRALARDLGYRPNAAARSMLSGRCGAMAFVSCGNPGFDWLPLSLLHGIHAGLSTIHSRLVLDEVDLRSASEPAASPPVFRETAVDALLLYLHPAAADPLVEAVAGMGIPHIWLNRDAATSCIYPDEVQGGAMATAWLLERGHRRIGYFQLITPYIRPPHYSERDRARGCAERLAAAGAAADAVRAGMPGYHRHDGSAVAAARQYLDDHPDLTAVVAYGVEDASALVTASALAGRRVPGDLVVLAFGERRVSSYVGCRVHTIRVPFAEIGRGAVALAAGLVGRRGPEPASAVVAYPADAIA